MKKGLAVFVVITAAAVSLPVHAEDARLTCRVMGRNFHIGQTVCLRLPSGQNRLATCGWTMSSTAWGFTGRPCISSRLYRSVLMATFAN